MNREGCVSQGDSAPAGREPVRAEAYRQALYRWLRGLVKRRGTGTGALLTPEDEETLRALGYLN